MITYDKIYLTQIINMPQKRSRGTWKQPIFGIFERDSQVYAEVVMGAKQTAFFKTIKWKINSESLTFTD